MSEKHIYIVDPFPSDRIPFRSLINNKMQHLLVESILMNLSSEQATIRELIDQRARDCGNKCAFIFPEIDYSITYNQLRTQILTITSWLTHIGCKKGDKVAYALENGSTAIKLYLGVQYSGFIAVPLNPLDSLEKLCRHLLHCEAKVLIAELNTEHVQRIKNSFPDLQVFSSIQETLSRQDEKPLIDRNNLFPLSGENENVLNYTSGTTGVPKGVMMNHLKVLASARIHVQAQEQTEKDIGILLLPLHHMNAQHVSVLSTLYSGSALVVPRRFIASKFFGLVDKYQVTWFAAVPTILSELNQISIEYAGTSLRFGRCSSAPLSKQLHKDIEIKLRIPIIEAMGMTESGGTFFFNPLPPQVRKTGSVGVPVGYKIKIVDDKGKEAEFDTSGRIMVRGESIMDEYYKYGDQKAVKNGWLNTGDIGWRDKDGYYFISGRDSEIVIKGGVNISTKEIEEVLLNYEEILEAAAVGITDEFFGQTLVAFVVLRDASLFDEKALLEWCRTNVGLFKAPVRVLQRNQLPRTSMGKIRKEVLRQQFDPAMASVTGDQDKVFSYNELLIAITAIWERILNVSPVLPSDNFFDLGGYSLAAVQVLIEIEKEIGTNLPVSIFLEHGSVGELALAISNTQKNKNRWKAVVPVKSTGRKPPFFGVFAEDHVLFYYNLARELDTDQPFYGIQSPTMSKEVSLPARLTDLASIYVEEIRTIQPEGPYLVGGQCTGSKIAYEIAKQLKDSGEEVALLVIFDTSGPAALSDKKGVRHYAGRSVYHVVKGTIFRIAFTFILYKWINYRKRHKHTKHRREYVKDQKYGPTGKDLNYGHKKNEEQVKGINRCWTNGYLAEPYSGKVVLIRSTQYANKKRKEQGVDRWKQLVANLDICVIPGGHLTIFHEPYVRYLAKTLQSSIDEAMGSKCVTQSNR